MAIYIMKRKLTFVVASLLTFFVSLANDYAVLTNGSLLQPQKEVVDVEIKSEVLTIRLADENRAYVDVDYTFYNHGDKTDMTVAFVANLPSEGITSYENLFDGSPFIHDFVVEMNGNLLPIETAATGISRDYDPKLITRDGYYYDGKETQIQYIYTFPATFEKGENKVHHTYSYDITHSVFAIWNIEYELSPAANWKNHKIGKFTLNIECPNTAKHFYVNCEDLYLINPIFTKGVGKFRKDGRQVEISMRNAVAQWTLYDYKPESRLDIYSVSNLEDYKDGDPENHPYGYSYDRGPNFTPTSGNLSGHPKILRNIPYAHRGYIFKTKDMKKCFENLWWYIPDSNYVPDMSHFTEKELMFINGTYTEKK